MPSPEEIDRRVAASLATPHRTRAERLGRPSPHREILCRTCGQWTLPDPTPTGAEPVWTRHHSHDGTPSCTPFSPPKEPTR